MRFWTMALSALVALTVAAGVGTADERLKKRDTSSEAAAVQNSSPGTAPGWLQDGFDAAHSAASLEALSAELHVRWRLDLPRPKPAWPDQPRMDFDSCYRPLVIGPRVIVTSGLDDSVTAYSLSDGRPQWRFCTGGPVRLAPASDGARIFVGSDDGWLYALSAESGTLLWKFKGAPKSRPVLGNGRLIDTWCVRGGPVVAEGRVYFAAGIWPFMGVFLHCLDAATGRPQWSNTGEGAEYMPQPHGGAISFGGIAPQGTLTVAGDSLLVPGGRSLPGCYDRNTGQRRHFLLPSQTGGHALAAVGDYYFCAGEAYDLATGKSVGPALAHPVLDGGGLYGFTGGGIARVEFAQYRAAKKADDKIRAVPTIVSFPEGSALVKAGPRLYAGGKGKVAAFDLPLAAGKPPAWQTAVEGKVGALAAARGHLLVATDQGRIYCLGVAPAVPPAAARPAVPSPAATAIERARAILKDSGAGGGYAVLLGAGSGELARALVSQSSLHVVILEAEATRAETLRKQLGELGLYGERIAVYVGDIGSAMLPPYFANLVVAQETAGLPAGAEAYEAVFRILHPYHGKAYFKADADQQKTLADFAAGAKTGKATVEDVLGFVRLQRSGGLPGAGNWTHEHGDAANTRVSADTLVKAPLGLLWFGGSSHEGILPRHGHGPQPQVLDGRLVIEKVDGLRSMDIYTGRVLWEAVVPGLGSYYTNTAHQYGANGVGTNYISTPEGIYVRYGRDCLRLDPASGKCLATIALPRGVAGAGDADSIWGYLSVTGDHLIGSVASPDTGHPALARPSSGFGEGFWGAYSSGKPAKEVPQAIEGQSLFVMDRRRGEVLWSAVAKGRFRHNAICAGGGRLYAIDRPPARTASDKPVGVPPARLIAFDLASGKILWSKEGVFGTWLAYSTQHDVLIASGNRARDSMRGEPHGMRAYRAGDGHELWYDPLAAGPPLVHRNLVIRDHDACGLLDGKPLQVSDPLTGQRRPWSWTRTYGCNTPSASQHLLTFRSGAAGYYDLARCGGTGNWGGFKSSCSNNLIVAGGLITAPEYTRTCVCSYPNQTSLALVPDPDAEMWTFQGIVAEPRGPVRRLGVNFGAPGNRVDDRRTLWLEYPRMVDAPGKKVGKSATNTAAAKRAFVTVTPAQVKSFRQHSSVVSGPLPWVCASGVVGVQSVRVAIQDRKTPGTRYTVRLYFAEPEDLRPGDRPFTISLQGKEVAKDFDVVKEAGGPRRGIVKEFVGVHVEDELLVTLTPSGSRPPILCGLEVVGEF